MICIIGVGLVLSFRTRFLQIRKFPYAMKVTIGRMFRKKQAADGAMTPFQAVCTALAATVGTGNIAGVAGAIAIGGPGAVFWMWVIAILGAATGFVESTLAQIYKAPRKGGGYVGGPAYYIGNVLGSPFFAWLFAVLLAVTYGLIFNSVQSNTIALSLKTSLSADPWYTGLAIAVLTALVIFGLTRIAKVVGMLVPVMAGAYLLVALIVTIMNITLVPDVLKLIVTSAFSFDSAMGAGFGLAVMTGVKRGLFSNEAGMGSVPNAAATADATHPVKQGLVQALGVFVDTLMVCTASAMIVLLSPDWQGSGLTGIELAQHALTGQLGSWTNIFMTVMILFFAFSSIIGNYFYGEVNMDFISRFSGALWIYRALVVCMVFFGAVASLDLVWSLADLFMALMAMLNLGAILLLGRYAFIVQKDYFRQKAEGIAEPEFDPSILPTQKGILAWPRKDED